MIVAFSRWNISVCRKIARLAPNFFGGESYQSQLQEEIKSAIQSKSDTTRPRILEIGGFDRPLLPRSEHYFYAGLDVDHNAACDLLYDEFLVGSVTAAIPGKWDIIISRTLLEHVDDNLASSRNMFAALSGNGHMVHYAPSKWHPYSIALRLVGTRLQRRLIRMLRPHAVGETGYKAFFDQCSPSVMKKAFRNAGFAEARTKCFYRANDYFSFFFPIFIVVSIYENICKFFGLDFLCSGFIITSKRTDGSIVSDQPEH